MGCVFFGIVFSLSPFCNIFIPAWSGGAQTLLRTADVLTRVSEPYWCRRCGCLDASRWPSCGRDRCRTSVWWKAGSLSPIGGIYLEQRPSQKTLVVFSAKKEQKLNRNTDTHTHAHTLGSSGCCRGPAACWASLFLSRWAISLVTPPAHEELRVSQAH